MNILIEYPENILDINQLKTCTEEFNETEVVIYYKKYGKRIIGGVEELWAAITIYLEQEAFQNIFFGLVQDIVFLAFTKMVSNIYNIFKDKKLYKISKGEIVESSLSINIKYGKTQIILPNYISDEKFKYTMDKLFETINNEEEIIKKEETILKYTEEINSFKVYPDDEYDKKLYEESSFNNKKIKELIEERKNEIKI